MSGRCAGYKPGVNGSDSGVANRFLEIYLRDHHAAGTAGVGLAKRAAAGTSLGPPAQSELSEIATRIEEDLHTLEALMAALGVERSASRDTAAALAERFARLKSNGTLVKRSPLSDVIELEALASGILAKEALWISLSVGGPGLAGVDLGALVERARQQRETVESWRRAAAARAFDHPADPRA